MAPERNDTVLEMVEQELRADREASTDYLQSRAVSIDPTIAELTPQSFNARYPLVIKRKFAREEGRFASPNRRRPKPQAPQPPSHDSPTDGKGGFWDDLERAVESKQRPNRLEANGSHVNGNSNGNGNGNHADATTDSRNSPSRIGRPSGTRRRRAQAKIEGPTLEFNDTALRTTLLRLMRDVADAAGKSPGKLVEVVAKVDSYASDVKETVRIANLA